MYSRRLKAGYFVLEGLNSFATSFYFYYLFFYMSAVFGFGNRGNLALACLNGFVYTFAAIYGGRFAQRRGYFLSLKTGFSVMIIALLIAGCFDTVAVQCFAIVIWTLGMCFTWPTLEALISEGEDRAGTQRMVGIYNLVWSSTAALAYFSGGFLWETFGRSSLFWIPILIHLGSLALLLFLERQAGRPVVPGSLPQEDACKVAPVELNPRPIAKARLFQRLAWMANPFAYMAINAIAPVIPTLAKQFALSPTLAGFVCSLWFFARFGAFVALWLWPGWHYRFRWFIGAYVLLLVSFLVILLVPNLAVLIVAQVAFGTATGLMYYSSLFYSMDVGHTKGEHGGMHESALGAGIFLGPATGAAALQLWPANPNHGTLAVAALLLLGLIAICLLRARSPSAV